ncbi:MAG: AAA family ATPase [Candidatus Dormibacteria bacterium]|jgi:predicted ATPase
MKLTSFQVGHFRNILDSGQIPTPETITCLVGKNESGKTNLLHALHAINPALKDRTFDEQQYPRWLQKEHQRTGQYARAIPISVTFELDPSEVAEVHTRYGAGVLTSPIWTISKRYDGSRILQVEVDEEAACREVEARAGTSTGAIKLAALLAQLETAAAETEPDASGAQVPTEGANKAASARTIAQQLYPDGQVQLDVGKTVAALMPPLFYFDDYSRLEGRMDIAPILQALRDDNLSSLSPAQQTTLALLRLGYAGDQLIDPNYEKRSAEMEAVAADLTRQVRRYWHQNEHLRLEIDIEPIEEGVAPNQHIIRRMLQLRVMDDRHFFTNNLDVRSSGFRWFVSFLAAFKEFETDDRVIVLLDEPALALHARAQADFLAFIEDTLATRHQVIYTTHSPFMIDPAHLERVRVVEDLGPETGAVVREQLMSHDPDTLSPLQGALGYDIAQNIFVGPDNLVVEGLADYTYLVVMSEALRAAGRTALDPRWRVLPAGGAGSIPAVVSLLGRELDVTVVVDGGSHPPQRITKLIDAGLLERTRVITMGPLAEMNAADIEDLFHPDDYLSLYNGATSRTLTSAALPGAGDRILARLEAVGERFNHNDPSNWLLANRAAVVPGLRPETLSRFEALFQAINQTLR